MASSAFSFHCMICFEEFDTQTNYPVVLPCGHTYVCIECANRLDKCMECRTPLTMKVEMAAPPPPPGGVLGATGTPVRNGAVAPGGGHPSPDAQKENMNYADRVRNSPGFRRRYGHQYNNNGNVNNNTRGGPSHYAAPTPPPPPVKQRLPLPKNAVLLSLIQASEPARRRAEVEAPPTPQKTEDGGASLAGSKMPSPERPLPKFSRSSPLLLDSSSSGEQQCGNDPSASNLVGSLPDDEEHKIRVGTYLEGGPCGTYAVAVKSGLLVYPTLFEHTLPNGLRREDEDVVKRDVEELVKKHRASMGVPRLDNVAAMASAASEEADDGDEDVRGLMSLTISEDESDDGGDDATDVTARILPVRRSCTIHGAAMTPKKSPLLVVKDDSSQQQQQRMTKKFSRHFSQGSYPEPSQKRDPSQDSKNAIMDEFDRPLIRLKYGDRVQVVSMDKRGWVKLARGYGYIRLENDKQLVKVGGTSDKACQIEAMLHELSIERNRLKQEQTKLERLSAGLMIDLQSSLITSDDHVVVSAPEGSLRRGGSEIGLSLLGTGGRLDTSGHNSVSLDDIEVSNRSNRTMRTPPRSAKQDGRSPPQPSEDRVAHREIRTTQSHSPARTPSSSSSLVRGTAGNVSGAPPSPPYGQVRASWSSASATGYSPMRVDFRTGLSGHRALTSSHSHPHDFIEGARAHPAVIRSMSNHAGISTNVSVFIPESFWESPCAGGV